VFVAFEAGGVSGGVVSRGLGGPRLRAYEHVPLEAGALAPHPVEPNLVRQGEVRDALVRLREGLRVNGRRASLILPDGLARIGLIEAPEGVAPLEFARYRLTPSLPYPAGEAVVDGLSLGRRAFLAAAVRRSCIEAYESAAAEAGFVQERIDMAPLAALVGLLRRAPGTGCTVDLILGDAAFSLAGFDAGALRVFRSRRRDRGPEEAERLIDEIDRTALLAGGGAATCVRVVGPGAGALIGELAARGRWAEPGWQAPAEGLPVEAAEVPWLGAGLS
jgi:hypothetical protein